jgi:nucleoside-diphosphate-sugar epimerase
MVIGDGSIATIFHKKYDSNQDYLIFASGVSDSNQKNNKEFEREKTLVLNSIEKYPESKFVYFSSIFVESIKNEYYSHKLEIENLIKTNCDIFLIIRLPQIISLSGNRKNLINLFVDSIKNNKEIIIYKNTFRSIIDIDDVFRVVDNVLDKCQNDTLLFSGIESIEVINLCEKISKSLSTPPVIRLVEGINSEFKLDNSKEIEKAIHECNIDKINYIDKILKKYIK